MEVNLHISDWAVESYTWYKQQKKNRSTVLHQNLKLLCFKTYIKKMKREPTELEKRYLPIIYLIRDLHLEDIKCICIYV